MIKFYLSGATSPDEFQNNPEISLGGYISSAEVKNGELDSLFGGVSEFSKTNRSDDYSFIVVKNVGGIKTDFTIKIINPVGSFSVMSLAVVNPSQDTELNPIFEKIPNKSTAPYYADFADEDGVTIASVPVGAIYGVWLKRVLTTAARTPATTDELNTAFDSNTPLPQEDDVIVDIVYTE